MLKNPASFAMFLAVYQAPIPIPGQTADHGATDRKQLTSNTRKGQEPATPPPVPNPDVGLAALRGQPNTDQRTGENKPDTVAISKFPSVSIDRDWVDCLMLAFNAGLILIGYFGVRAAVRTLRAIERQAHLMQEQNIEAKEANARATTFAHGNLVNLEVQGQLMRRQADLMEGQLGEMQEAAKQAARQLGLTERPWISPSVSIVSPLTADENGIHLTLRVQLTNVGNSPAVGIWITPTLFLSSMSDLGIVGERKRICDQALNVPVDDLGQILFPSATPAFAQDWVVHATAEHVKKSSVGGVKRGIVVDNIYANGMYSSQIILCISYRSTLDPTARHYTAPIYNLSMIDPANPKDMRALPSQTTIPLERLRLSGTIFGTIAT
jgi:hypothetical protein